MPIIVVKLNNPLVTVIRNVSNGAPTRRVAVAVILLLDSTSESYS